MSEMLGSQLRSRETDPGKLIFRAFLASDTLAGIAFVQFLVIRLQRLQQIPRESSGFGRVLLLLVFVVLGFLEATLFLPVSTVTKTLITNQ